MCQGVAATSLHSYDVNSWRVQDAPAPFELLWGNLSMTLKIKTGRANIV